MKYPEFISAVIMIEDPSQRDLIIRSLKKHFTIFNICVADEESIKQCALDVEKCKKTDVIISDRIIPSVQLNIYDTPIMFIYDSDPSNFINIIEADDPPM
jgi:hypothetical protein